MSSSYMAAVCVSAGAKDILIFAEITYDCIRAHTDLHTDFPISVQRQTTSSKMAGCHDPARRRLTLRMRMEWHTWIFN